jgi:BASS family bile acid:Na+ symporter
MDNLVQVDGLLRYGLSLANLLIMFGIGMGLSAGDFVRLAGDRRPLLAGVAGQYLLLPVLGFLVAGWLLPSVELALGFVLVAACPSASASNALTWLARGNVALAVTLTALSAVLALVAIPLALAVALHWFAGEAQRIQLPVASMLAHLAVLVLLPVACGMLVRRQWPAFGARAEPWFNRGGMAMLLLLVGVIAFQQRAVLSQWLGTLAPAVVALCVSALAGGYLLAWAIRLPRRDAVTVALEVGVQNCLLALLIAYNVLGLPLVGMPAAIYGVLMYPLALLLVFAYRWRSRALAATGARLQSGSA